MYISRRVSYLHIQRYTHNAHVYISRRVSYLHIKRYTHNAQVFVKSVSESTLILISMDGFRADYLLRGFTPVLQKLVDCGVHARFMRAAFPTKTFPNHYTLATARPFSNIYNNFKQKFVIIGPVCTTLA